jgi:hypothetical protein
MQGRESKLSLTPNGDAALKIREEQKYSFHADRQTPADDPRTGEPRRVSALFSAVNLHIKSDLGQVEV